MDIKHMDPAKHKAYTGADNTRILENARKVAASRDCELIIRVPVVPTFNDTPQEIGNIAEFAASLPGVRQIHLLPYHRLGQDKYTGLGRDYTLTQLTPPPQEHMQELLESAERVSGLACQIGG